MARSPSDPFVERALELFSALGLPVSARRMFGGLGFYAGGLFFAIGDHEEGQLWLKVDDESRPAFEAMGGQPFTYTTARREVMTMAYLSPPDAAMEDAEAMRPWASLGVAAARRAAAAKAEQAAKPRAPKARPARAKAPKRRPTAARAAGPRAARRGRS
jgi:DNA transformation protein